MQYFDADKISPSLNYRDRTLDLNGKKTNFQIEFFEDQEKSILEDYWLCKTHPR